MPDGARKIEPKSDPRRQCRKLAEWPEADWAVVERVRLRTLGTAAMSRLGELLLSGDNLFRDGCVGVIDAHHGSSIPDFIKSLTRIRESDVQWLLPSHGPIFRKRNDVLQSTIDRLDGYQHMADFGTCAIDWPLMDQWEREDTTIYKVVINHEEQYSIWPANRSNAMGWTDTGKSGSKAECLSYIEQVWTDMRPLSLRVRMGDTRI